ncbi:MAG: xanthine dehydrogenase family protein subunit M [Elusimicrobia bacterium]|nr:xanthine dehydrogenase family protein subunit M [Elusimicrobiota bacterium]
MHIKELDYLSPATLAEACGLLHSGGPGAKVFAGGTDILPDLKRGRVNAASLISLAGLDGLKKIEKRNSTQPHPSTLYPLPSTLFLGPLVTPDALDRSALVREIFPGLSEAAASMAANQVRGLATLGGNLCSAVPSADLPPSLLTAEAELVLTARDGERRLALKDFFLGPRKTALRLEEILTGILIPELPRGTGTAYDKFQARDASALAIVGAAARLTVKDNKIVKALVAIGACAPTPLLIAAAGEFLAGKEPSGQNFARAGELAAQAIKPISDLRGSAQYRREICRVLTIRVLKRAFERA